MTEEVSSVPVIIIPAPLLLLLITQTNETSVQGFILFLSSTTSLTSPQWNLFKFRVLGSIVSFPHIIHYLEER